jgi:hypothetical protein
MLPPPALEDLCAGLSENAITCFWHSLHPVIFLLVSELQRTWVDLSRELRISSFSLVRDALGIVMLALCQSQSMFAKGRALCRTLQQRNNPTHANRPEVRFVTSIKQRDRNHNGSVES